MTNTEKLAHIDALLHEAKSKLLMISPVEKPEINFVWVQRVEALFAQARALQSSVNV